MELQLYRNESPHISIPIDESTVFSQTVMGEHVIRCPFISFEPVDINEGDYIMFRGERFTLNRPFPPVQKSSASEFSYNLEFEGYIYDLLDMPYMHLGALEWSLYGPPRMFLQILVDCMNSIGSGWSIGSVDEVPEQTLAFYESGRGVSCKGALVRVAEAFKLEFWLNGKTINLTKQAGVLTNITFEYGRGRGLYSITRGKIDDAAYFNRLYIQGSDKNIPVGYRDGAKRLQIDLPYLELPLTGGKKRRASSVVIDDIFPKRVGTLTVVSANMLTLTDTSLDFDINSQRIEGQKATVEVVSGANAGRSFEIASYNHTSRSINITPIVESDGYTYPNTAFDFKAGDQYFLAGIIMPQTYVTTAESDLKSKGLEILNQGSNLIPPYAVEVQDHFMKENGIIVNAGDRVGLKDADLDLDAKIRVSAIKLPIVNPDQIDLIISDVVIYNTTEKALIEVDRVKQETVVIDKTNVEQARRAAVNLRSLENSIFDTDGMFDVDKFNVGVLKAALGIFGAASSNFILKGVYVNVNYQGNPNSVNISQGTLSHLEIKGANGSGDWIMAASTQTGLVPASLYYIYAKCSRSSQSGTFVITTTQYKYDQDPSFYYFLMGVVYPVNGTYRDSDMSYGISSINGNRIKTGRIESVDGLTWFDLNNAEFHGKFTFTSGANVEQTIIDRANTAQSNAKTYSDGLKASLDGELDDLNTELNTLNTTMTGAFKDGIISQAEAIAIKNQIKVIDNEKADFDNRYTSIYNDASLTGTPKTELASAKTTYNTSYTALIGAINAAITTGSISPAGITDVNNKFADYKTKIGTLSLKLDAAISFISQAKASKALTDANTFTQGKIDEINQDINDVSVRIDNLATDINQAFFDGIVSEAEANSIRKYINTLNTEKVDVDNRYTAIYNNASLSGSAKTNLGAAKSVMDTAHANLISSINTAIADGKATEAESTDVDSKFAAYRLAIATLSTRFEQAINFIAQNKVDSLQIGGRNLLRNSGISVTTTANRVAFYSLAEPMIVGQEYTISFLGSLSSGSQYYEIYLGTSTGTYLAAISRGDSNLGVRTATFIGKAGPNVLSIYNSPTGSTSATIGWAMLTKGNKAAVDWSPAPEDIVAEANAYTQGQLIAVNKDIQDVSTRIDSLDTYIDGAFSDGVVDTAEAKAIEKYLNSIGSEKGDIDNRYNVIYGDTLLTGTTKSNLATAKGSYDTAHSALLSAINTAISDGKATTAEKTNVDSKFAAYKAAIATLSTRFEQAINFIGQAKATAAQNAAGGYTDTKSAETLAAAQTYANNAAQSKADIAQAAAISTASADAQTKATAAQNAATLLSQQLIEGLAIGVRNYIAKKFIKEWARTGLTVTSGTDANGSYIRFNNVQLYNVLAGGESHNDIFEGKIKFLPGTQYTLSIKISTEGNQIGYFGLWYTDGTKTNLNLNSLTVNVPYTTSVTSTAGKTIDKVSFVYNLSANCRIYEMQMVTGTKSNDWIPAVEDVQLAIDAAKAAADAAQTAYNNLTGQLKSMAYQDVVELAKLGTTVIQNGYLRSTLIDVAYLKANVINAGYINSLQIFGNTLQTVNTGAGYIRIEGNTILSYNPNGNIARKQTVENGVVKDIWYTVDGRKYYEIGQEGQKNYITDPNAGTGIKYETKFAYKSNDWSAGCVFLGGNPTSERSAWYVVGGPNNGKYYDDASLNTPCNGYYYAMQANEAGVRTFSRFTNGLVTAYGDCQNGVQVGVE
jgi:hypothetical protein